MPLEGIVNAIRERAIPHDKNWFAYKTSEEAPQRFLAERLGRELGLPFEPADIALTTGAFAAIMVAFHLVLDAGDEAIFSEPAWFCYEPLLLAAAAVPRKIALKAPAFDLDLGAIDAAIGPRTRLVIINTPHNPTGRIYTRHTLEKVADSSAPAASATASTCSDEPYRDSASTDGSRGLAAVYPWTFISYSYVLFAPGQRLGYLGSRRSCLTRSVEPSAVRWYAQMSLGWCFLNVDAVRHTGPRDPVDRSGRPGAPARSADGHAGRQRLRRPPA